MVHQGNRLRDMVEQLLRASAVAANRSPVLRAGPVDLADVVGEVVADRRAAEPDRPLRVHLPARCRPVRGDAEALRVVVANLVDNACKYSPPGSPVTISVEQPAGWTSIAVADRGAGIPPEDRARVFTAFTQLDASATRRAGGVGLGLFLVRRLVEAMGGWARVDGGADGGARFVVELPGSEPPAA